MSFVWKRPEGRLKSPEQVARELLELAREMGLDEFAAVLATMCVAQESDFWCPWNRADDSSQRYAFDSESNDGRSVGYFQQQNGIAGENPPASANWWGPMSSRMDLKQSARKFYERLEKSYHEALNDPGMASRRFIQNVQRSGAPEAYAKHWDRAWQLVRAEPPPPPPPPSANYGLPTGSNSGGYGGDGVRFPDWVYQLGNAFGVKPSTYPGHQETDRIEAGYARNPQHLNRAIDWAAPGDPDEINKLTRFADYLATIPQFLEQVIWKNPLTGRSIEVAGGRHQPGYFADDLPNHQDHVHTRQSAPIPLPGGAPAPPPLGRPRGTHRNGNATWLADALRAEGLRVVEYPGWREKSNGNNFGEISGVIMHHTGSNNATAASIFDGRPDLSGPLSQLHLARDGTVTTIAAGSANHAGTGALPWLPAHTGNRRTIGIEAANDGGGTPGKPHRSSWPDVQYDAYVRIVKVILWETGWNADHVASHQEYDKGDPATFEGKWDPGAIDMNIFRADVQNRLDTTTGDDELTPEQDQMLRAIFREQTQRHPSRSALREPREGLVDTWAGMDLNTDGNVDFLATERRARLGHPGAIARLQRVAAGGEAGRSPDDANLATAILAELDEPLESASAPRHAAIPSVFDTDAMEKARLMAENAKLSAEIQKLEAETEMLRATLQRETAAPLPAVISAEQTTGQVIGNAYDALQQLRLADALPIEDRAPLAALIAVLQTKNGSEIK